MSYYKISWQNFRAKYFQSNAIFAFEHDDRWCFYTYEGPMKIKCEILKYEDSQDQALFEAGVFHSRYNITELVEDPEYEEEEIEDEYEYPQIGDDVGV